MSLIEQIKQYRSNKSGESASSIKVRSWTVRDSRPSLNQCITNLSTGTFTRLIPSIILITTTLALLFLTIPFFISSNVFATASSITVSIDDSTIDLNVAPTGQGAFSKSNTTTIGVSTTNYTGYTLSIAAQEGDNPTALVNGSDSSKTLSSINSAITESQFKALDSTSYNNQWGYLPSNLCTTTTNNTTGSGSTTSTTCATNTSFLPSPTTSGDTLDITSTANSTANEYEIALGARVDTTASLGSYSNVFLVNVTANAIPYTITFVDNTVSSMPVDMSGNSDVDTVSIVNTVPVRNGYTFLGWCRGTVVNNANGNDTCTGTGSTIYNPNGNGTNLNVAIDQQSSSNNITLYAMWGNNYTITGLVSGNGTLQDLGNMDATKKAKVISSMIEETNYTLKDSRDNQNYTIAKLKDGQIWMTKNLNLAGGTEIESTGSDVTSRYTLPTEYGFGPNNTLPASSTTGFDNNTDAFVYNSGSTTCGDNSPCYSYYSYTAATAGSSISITTVTDAPWSICPKGWRLPTSGAQNADSDVSYKRGDFYRLAVAYGANLESLFYEYNTIAFDNLGPGTTANFLLAGSYGPSGFRSGGLNGYYQSGTSAASGYRYFFTFDAENHSVGSASSGQRRSGVSMRCILR